MRILAFTKYGQEAASTRQRLLQYLPAFERAGINVDHHFLLDDDYVRSLATGERSSRLAILRSYGRRLHQLHRARNYDLIWVYAELFPYLPARFEGLIYRYGKPLIYDFDDAFFIPYDQHRYAVVRHLLGSKLKPLLRGAAACCCGNAFLQAYAQKFCSNSIIVPTVVDTDVYVPRTASRNSEALVIGWIGSPSTWANIKPLLPLLRELCADRDVQVRAVGGGVIAHRDQFPGLELVDWSEASEVREVQAMDIGIMPLSDLPFERGKSGYKLIQYMACGLPVVASPVGVNRDIVNQGANGFLAQDEAQWRSALTRLIDDAALRKAMGDAGRERAVRDYSLASQAPRLVKLFRSVALNRM